MIRINLLPHELRPIKRTPLPYIGGALLIVAAIAGVAVMMMSVTANIAGVNAKIANSKAEFSKTTKIVGKDGNPLTLDEVVKEHKSLFERKDLLEKRVAIITDILSDRIIWSEQLFRLTKLTPDNIWYKRIRVNWKDFKEKQYKLNKKGEPELDKKTKEPIVETKVVKKPILEISGYVIPDEQGNVQITELFGQLVKDPDFSRQFTDPIPVLKDTAYNDFRVREFTLEFRIVTDLKSDRKSTRLNSSHT